MTAPPKPDEVSFFQPTPVSEPIPATITPTPPPTPTETPVIAPTQKEPSTKPSPAPTSGEVPVLYYSQSGDTLDAVAARFGVKTNEISSANPLPKTSLIDPGTLLVIPEKLTEYGPDTQVMPDSEIIFSVSAVCCS